MGVCVRVCIYALSNAFFSCLHVHMVDVCAQRRERKRKMDDQGINVCVCTWGWLQGGPVCGCG